MSTEKRIYRQERDPLAEGRPVTGEGKKAPRRPPVPSYDLRAFRHY